MLESADLEYSSTLHRSKKDWRNHFTVEYVCNDGQGIRVRHIRASQEILNMTGQKR